MYLQSALMMAMMISSKVGVDGGCLFLILHDFQLVLVPLYTRPVLQLGGKKRN